MTSSQENRQYLNRNSYDRLSYFQTECLQMQALSLLSHSWPHIQLYTHTHTLTTWPSYHIDTRTHRWAGHRPEPVWGAPRINPFAVIRRGVGGSCSARSNCLETVKYRERKEISSQWFVTSRLNWSLGHTIQVASSFHLRICAKVTCVRSNWCEHAIR